MSLSSNVISKNVIKCQKPKMKEYLNDQRFIIFLNQSDQDTLLKLHGIGESTANNILSARDKNSFSTIDDVLQIKGMGKKRLTKIQKSFERLQAPPKIVEPVKKDTQQERAPIQTDVVHPKKDTSEINTHFDQKWRLIFEDMNQSIMVHHHRLLPTIPSKIQPENISMLLEHYKKTKIISDQDILLHIRYKVFQLYFRSIQALWFLFIAVLIAMMIGTMVLSFVTTLALLLNPVTSIASLIFLMVLVLLLFFLDFIYTNVTREYIKYCNLREDQTMLKYEAPVLLIGILLFVLTFLSKAALIIFFLTTVFIIDSCVKPHANQLPAQFMDYVYQNAKNALIAYWKDKNSRE